MAGAWYAYAAVRVGYELIATGMLILAGGGSGKPLDHERWSVGPAWDKSVVRLPDGVSASPFVIAAPSGRVAGP
jgi:hypothetical protein